MNERIDPYWQFLGLLILLTLLVGVLIWADG
jgi:hypothetical protein